MKRAALNGGWHKVLPWGLAMILASGLAEARENPAEARGSVIKGNQEQPKVLYIVPWQPPTNPELTVPKPKTEGVLSLSPVEREFHRQSLYYRRHLKLGVLPDSP